MSEDRAAIRSLLTDESELDNLGLTLAPSTADLTFLLDSPAKLSALYLTHERTSRIPILVYRFIETLSKIHRIFSRLLFAVIL